VNDQRDGPPGDGGGAHIPASASHTTNTSIELQSHSKALGGQSVRPQEAHADLGLVDDDRVGS
jgi:hypothetical protein